MSGQAEKRLVHQRRGTEGMIGAFVAELARRELAQLRVHQRNEALNPLLVPVGYPVEESGDFRRLAVHKSQDTAFPSTPPLPAPGDVPFIWKGAEWRGIGSGCGGSFVEHVARLLPDA